PLSFPPEGLLQRRLFCFIRSFTPVLRTALRPRNLLSGFPNHLAAEPRTSTSFFPLPTLLPLPRIIQPRCPPCAKPACSISFGSCSRTAPAVPSDSRTWLRPPVPE